MCLTMLYNCNYKNQICIYKIITTKANRTINSFLFNVTYKYFKTKPTNIYHYRIINCIIIIRISVSV